MVDDFTRTAVAIEMDCSLPDERVVQVLQRLATTRGLPTDMMYDNEPEYAGLVKHQWASRRGVRLRFIEPGKPVRCTARWYSRPARRPRTLLIRMRAEREAR
jgi:putative transposase